MRASIILLCRDRWEETARCLASLRRSTPRGGYELLVYDNASQDETPARLRELAGAWPELEVFRNERNPSFAACVNRGMRRAKGRFLVWLNNDTVLSRGWLEGLAAAAESDARIGAAGPMTDNMAPPAQKCRPFRTRRGGRVLDTPFLGGFCMMLKRSALEAVGPLDERFVWGWEDIDYCARLRQRGYRLVLARGVFVRHAGSRTIAAMPSPERARSDLSNRNLMLRKWVDAEPWRGDVRRLFLKSPAPWDRSMAYATVLVACGRDLGRAAARLAALRRCADETSYKVLAVTASGGPRAEGLRRLARAWPELELLGPWPRLSPGAALNAAAERAGGDFLAVLDKTTEPRPGWLSGLVAAARSEPDAGLAVPAAGRGLLVARRVFQRVGGFDERLAGSLLLADYRLRVVHAGFKIKTADGVRLPLRAAVRGRRVSDAEKAAAARKWFEPLWLPEAVEATFSKSDWLIRPQASIVVVCRRGFSAARKTLESLRRSCAGIGYEVLAAEVRGGRAVSPGLAALARDWPELRPMGPWEPVPYGHAVNLALRSARGENFVVLDDCAAPARGWLAALLASARSAPNVGVAAPRSPATVLRWQRRGARRHGRGATPVSFVRDVCLLIPRGVYARVGGFDDRFAEGLGAEDYCLRVRQAGYQVVVAEGASVGRPGREPADKARGRDAGLLFSKWAGHPLFPT